MADTFEWYVGIDWGSTAHVVCLVDAAGQLRGTRTVAHTVEAVQDATQWLRTQTGGGPAAVGIETPRGALVDTLLEHAWTVFALNPKQLDRFRDRFTVAGAKDDTRDAHTIADGLRTDPRAFRRVCADHPVILQLREVSRLRDELLAEEGRLANRLREQLYRVDAAWLTLCPAADDSWLWTILADAPDPQAWASLPRRRIAPALRAHRIRRITVEEVQHALRQPRLHVAAGVTDAVAVRIAALVPQLRLLRDQRHTLERRIDGLVAQVAPTETPEREPREHRDVEILQSLPGVGRMVTATMLAEAAGPLAARDYATLRAYTGVAPVTKQSGRRARVVHMRYACHHRLRNVVYHWARISVVRDAAARRYYEALRARGHHYARALRSVADRWLRILIALLRTGQLYDPTRFAAATAA